MRGYNLDLYEVSRNEKGFQFNFDIINLGGQHDGDRGRICL